MSEQPSSPLFWTAWARDAASELRLPSHEAHVLLTIATWCDGHGRCFPAVETVAAKTGKAVSTVKRIIGALTRRGLIVSRQRGRGATALRELVADAARRVGGQLSLFDVPATPAATGSASKRSPQGPARPPSVAGPERAPNAERERASSITGELLQSHGRDPEEPQKGTAEIQPRASAPHQLHPAHQEVVEILRRVDPVVDEMAVDIALRNFPAGDHRQAAEYVVVNTLGGWRHPAVKQLWDALRRQKERDEREKARCEERLRRSSPRRGGRRAQVEDPGAVGRGERLRAMAAAVLNASEASS